MFLFGKKKKKDVLQAVGFEPMRTYVQKILSLPLNLSGKPARCLDQRILSTSSEVVNCREGINGDQATLAEQSTTSDSGVEQIREQSSINLLDPETKHRGNMDLGLALDALIPSWNSVS